MLRLTAGATAGAVLPLAGLVSCSGDSSTSPDPGGSDPAAGIEPSPLPIPDRLFGPIVNLEMRPRNAVEQARCDGTGTPSSNNRQFLSVGVTHGQIGPLPPGGKEPPIWFFPGEIDDPAMWSRSLSPAEIVVVHEMGVDVSSSDLQGYWSFNEGQGQTVFDRSPAGNHGYLGSDPAADSADPGWIG